MRKTLCESAEGIAFKGDCLQKKHIGTHLWGVVNFLAQLLILPGQNVFSNNNLFWTHKQCWN